MHQVLVWGHVGLMMMAFGASPLGRLGLRFMLSRISDPKLAKATVSSFTIIFLAGGIAVTFGVVIGLVLAWDTGLTQKWIILSALLIVIAGISGVVVEDRWLRRLSRAEGDAFAAALQEGFPFLATLASPVIWLAILWLMIEKPA